MIISERAIVRLYRTVSSGGSDPAEGGDTTKNDLVVDAGNIEVKKNDF